MSEKRFRQFGLWVIDDPNLKINTVADLFDTKIMSIEEVVDLLNEQQATITELERKLNKYAKIGEEQLKQIVDLQDELNECRARPTLATDERGVVKVEYR